ncbi:hypothetical protein CCH79_00016065 [Gambusia affinis]|uniref:PARP12-like CCCH zinc finger tandem domain-containing protein n=1 Tax=Gambusia affinis TaxID=33528 RepID=A0A315VA27_GAMAF|nr:hypothetical protein CCH79_00016065 [Gambusia affinis]
MCLDLECIAKKRHRAFPSPLGPSGSSTTAAFAACLQGGSAPVGAMEAEILKFICANQGAVDAEELMFNLFPGESTTEVISNQSKFALCSSNGKQRVVARTSLRLCRKKDCPGTCGGLHLCRNFLFSGSCHFLQSGSPPVHFDTMTRGGNKVRRLTTVNSLVEPTFIHTTEWLWYWQDEFGKWNLYGPDVNKEKADVSAECELKIQVVTRCLSKPSQLSKLEDERNQNWWVNVRLKEV